MLLSVALVLVFTQRTEATDRFFSDEEGKSTSGRYAVTAKSPDNQHDGKRKAFQASFVYTCTDTQSGKILWTRKQLMEDPLQVGDDPANTYAFPKEGSPITIYVSDFGPTVIYTDWEDLILIDINGKEIGKINVIQDFLTAAENENYVSKTSVGPMWAGRSHWYFVELDSKDYFVIRPWWGRHLIIDLTTGRITQPTEPLKMATAKAEKTHAISVLQGDGTLERCDCCGGPHNAAFAAYLAGVLKIKDVVPALRKLEGDTSIGSSTMGGYDEMPQGRIDPFNYATYTTRQSIHLALRRLGETPGPFPCTRFKTQHKDYHQMKLYIREPVDGTRHANVSKLKSGMSPEQVINLLDCPDYIPARIWQYDIDADDPYTLAVSWTGDGKVQKIEVIRPALWQEGPLRDLEW